MFWPEASFWRLWGVALLLSAAGIAFFLNLRPAHSETARASFYSGEMHGRVASGARWRPMGLSAAHRTFPLGSRLRVCFLARCAVVVINDRGPAASSGRSLDLSLGAARAIGLERVGVGIVTFTRLP